MKYRQVVRQWILVPSCVGSSPATSIAMSLVKKETINIKINSQEAKANPPLGPVIGQRGINIKSFCDTFNQDSSMFIKGTPLLVKMVVFEDKSYKIRINGIDIWKVLNFNNISSLDARMLYEISSYLKDTCFIYKNFSIKSIFYSLASNSIFK